MIAHCHLAAMNVRSLAVIGPNAKLVVIPFIQCPLIFLNRIRCQYFLNTPRMMTRFAKDDNKISGIRWVGYQGEAGGAAIADVIFAEYNPGGGLVVTWCPLELAVNVNMRVRADPATGYPDRFYIGQTVFVFGDGMSYTSFNITVVHAPKLISHEKYNQNLVRLPAWPTLNYLNL